MPHWGPDGGLVEDVLHAVDCLPAVLHVADVPYQETETPGVFFKQRQDVFNMSSREVVETADCVSCLQKVLAEVGAYESGTAGHHHCGAGQSDVLLKHDEVVVVGNGHLSAMD